MIQAARNFLVVDLKRARPAQAALLVHPMEERQPADIAQAARFHLHLRRHLRLAPVSALAHPLVAVIQLAVDLER